MRPTPKKSWILIIILVLLTTQACNLITSIVSPGGTPVPSEANPLPPTPPAGTIEAPPTAPPPVETVDPVTLCPTPGEGNSLYLSRENGFCFLYPSSYPVQPDGIRPDEVLSILGPREPGESMEPAVVVLGLAYNGPADGLTSGAYAERWFNLNTAGSGLAYEPFPGSIGGQDAVILRNIPGFYSQRAAFVVANGIRYQITLVPQPEDVAVLAEAATDLWNLVTGSLVFFPPENDRLTIRPEEVCPAASADTAVYRSDLDGYCYLYPTTFSPDPGLPGRVQGGPVVLTDADFGEVRTSLTLGTFGYFPGQNPRQVIEPRGDAVDSLVDATMGGHPAVIFRNPQGPWASKQALILVDGFAYTIVAQPFEPGAYPGGMPYLNQLWDTVTGSLAFFTPWR